MENSEDHTDTRTREACNLYLQLQANQPVKYPYKNTRENHIPIPSYTHRSVSNYNPTIIWFPSQALLYTPQLQHVTEPIVSL